MFESIFTSTADNSINISQAAISLGASIVIGVIIAIVYMYICKKEGYQKNFIIGLLMLPAVVSVVILLVGSKSIFDGRSICTCKIQKCTGKC